MWAYISWVLPSHVFHAALFRHSGASVSHLGSLPPPDTIASVATIHDQLSQTQLDPVVLPSAATSTGLDAIQQLPQAGLSSFPSRLPPVSSPPLPVAQSLGLILSPALQPIPARLVRRIQSGEFVEMRDLLSDNVALHDQLEAVHGPLLAAHTPASLRPRLREVPSLVSWVFCFTAYMAVQTRDPVTRDQLAYCRLIIREALRHGGMGWLDYDRYFRSQAAIDRSRRWNILLPDLQASTVLGQRTGGGVFCNLCRGVDHTVASCALSCMQQPSIPPPAPTATSVQIGTGRRSVLSASSWTRSTRSVTPICSSWNMGTCSYPGRCSYRHICATCQRRHQACDCPETPEDSQYKHACRAESAPTSSASKRC